MFSILVPHTTWHALSCTSFVRKGTKLSEGIFKSVYCLQISELGKDPAPLCRVNRKSAAMERAGCVNWVGCIKTVSCVRCIHCNWPHGHGPASYTQRERRGWQVKLLPVMYITGVLKSQKKLDYMVSAPAPYSIRQRPEACGARCTDNICGARRASWRIEALAWALPDPPGGTCAHALAGVRVSSLLPLRPPQARHDGSPAQLHVRAGD